MVAIVTLMYVYMITRYKDEMSVCLTAGMHAHIYYTLWNLIFRLLLILKSTSVRGLKPWEEKDKPVSSLSPGTYVPCKSRSANAFKDTFIFSERSGDTARRVLSLLKIESGDDGDGPVDGLFSSIITSSFPCFSFGISPVDCPNDPEEGRTPLLYYFVGAQSYVPSMKNEIHFVSHYAEYEKNKDGDLESLDSIGDKEVTTMNIFVDGNNLVADVSIFLDAGVSYANSASYIFVKEEDGCDAE